MYMRLWNLNLGDKVKVCRGTDRVLATLIRVSSKRDGLHYIFENDGEEFEVLECDVCPVSTHDNSTVPSPKM